MRLGAVRAARSRRRSAAHSTVESPGARVARYDWPQIATSLDELGHARLPGLLDVAECRALVRLYSEAHRFRSFVDMARHRFGQGDYRYFAAPLPAIVQGLRTALYGRLAAVANAWNERLGRTHRFPLQHRAYERLCHAAGQIQPTPLLLHYSAGGYNCLHQDLYGPLFFPLQVTVLLSEPERDFTGGELLLVEQRPRMQSRGEALALSRGEGIVFPCRERPVTGARGNYRAAMRHGVSRIRSGERFALGIIFHDAR